MAALRDYLSPEALAKYPDESLTPAGRALLDVQIPADYPGSRARKYAQQVEQALPQLTRMAAIVRRHVGEPVPDAIDREAIARQTFARLPAPVQTLEQGMQGFAETVASPTEHPWFPSPGAPAPTSLGQRLARAGGGMAAFAAEAAPIAAATAGAGMAPIAAQALAAGIPAAAMPGTPKQRLVRGAVMAGAGAGTALAGGIAGEMVRSKAALEAPAFAAAAEREGGEAGARMLAEGTRRATGAIERTARVAEDVAAPLLFGGVAPYAEHAAMKAVGEPTEAPRAEDILSAMGGMALMGLAHGAGRAAFEARATPPDATAAPLTRPAGPAPESPAPEPGAPTAGPEAVERPATSLTPQAPVPQQVAGAVYGIAKGNGTTGTRGRLDNVARNPLDGNRTALQSFRERVQAAGATTDQEWVDAARRARRQVLGLSDLHAKLAEPPGSTPALRSAGEAASRQWTDYLGGKGIVLKGPKGSEIGGRVEAVFIYPWAPDQFRVALRDEQTGQVVARTYPDAAAFNADIAGMNRPPRAAAPKAVVVNKPRAVGTTEKPATATRAEVEIPDLATTDPKKAQATLAAMNQQHPGFLARVVESGGKHRIMVDKNALDFSAQMGFSEPKGGRPGNAAEGPVERESAPASQAPAIAPEMTPEQRAAYEAGRRQPVAPELQRRVEESGERLSQQVRALEQQSLAVPPREIPRTAAGKPPTKSAESAVAAMGAPAKTFDEHFADLVKRGEKPDDARAEAEKLSGTTPPMGFDAEARAKSLMHRAAEEAGQGSLFGAPQPAPATRGEPAAVPERKPEGAPVRAETRAEAAPVTTSTMRAQSLHFHEPFQPRSTEEGLIHPERIQSMLEEHGGFSAEETAKHPITVWRDEAGKIGPAGRVYVLAGHHRTHLAQHDWKQLESGVWDPHSVSDRDVAVAFHTGDYASALHEAETSNLKQKAQSNAENAGVAGRLAKSGLSDRDAALKMGVSGPKHRDLLYLSHLDPELQRQFFGEKGLPLNVGAFLGEFTKRYNVHPEHQRTWLTKLVSREIASADELQDVVEGYLRVLKAANQTELLSQSDMGANAISPRLAHDYLGRISKLVGRERRDAARGARDTKRLVEKGASKEQLKAAEVIADRYRIDLVRANRLDAEMQSRALKAINEATEKGESIADALHRVKEWVDAQMRHDPNEFGGAPMFSDGVAGRWLWKAIQRGVDRATRRAVANPIAREGVRMDGPQFTPHFDDYVNHATTRWWANSRLGNWQDFLPEPIANEYRAGSAREMMLENDFAQRWEAALGSHEAGHYFAEGGSGEIELAKALEGLPNTVPAKFADAIPRVRALLKYDHDIEVQHAKDTGQKEPAELKGGNYLPRIHLRERSEPLSALIEQIELRKGKDLADAEIDDIHNRFYERRTNRPGYEKRATFAIRERLRATTRKLAWDRMLMKVRDYLASPEAATSGLQRANLVRDWTRMRFFRDKSPAEQRIDEFGRRLLFQNVTQGIRDIDLPRAASALGKSVDQLKLEGVENVAWVPPGVEYDNAGGHARELGPFEGGRLVAYPEGETLMSDKSPLAREWLRKAAMFKRGPLVAMGLRGQERSLRNQWKVDRGFDDLYRSPTATMWGAVTGRITGNLFYQNIAFMMRNAGQTFVTTLPRYGLRSYLAGLRGATKAATRSALRAGLVTSIRAAEKMGYLDAGAAEAARKSMPLLLEEVYAEAAGTNQRENILMHQRAQDIADGKNPEVMAVIRGLITRGDWLNAASEGLNRTISILAAADHAEREYGSEPALRDRQFENLQQAREAMVEALANPNSRETLSTRSTLLDQFAYDPGSFPLAASGPFGRMFFQLMRWQIGALKESMKQSEGATRGIGAGVRGVVDATFQNRLGAAPRKTGETQVPPGRGWFDQWLNYNGAGWQNQDAGASFVRSVAISALLLGITATTGVAVSNIGIPPHVMLGLWLLRQFFQNDEQIASWYNEGRQGAMVGTSRAPVGPVPQAAFDIGSGFSDIAKQRGPAKLSQVPWDAILGAARVSLLKGEPEIRRLIQENPRWFEDHAPWVFKAMGVKRVLEDATPAQKVKHQVGVMTERERSELARKP